MAKEGIMDINKVEDAMDILTVDAPCVKEGSQVNEAVRQLIKNPCSRSVYVVDDMGRLKGVISYRDLMRAGSARFGVRKDGFFSFIKYMKDMYAESVEPLMRKARPVKMGMSLKDALKIMEEDRVNDLPIVNEDGELIGELNGMEILRFGVDIIEKGDANIIGAKKTRLTRKDDGNP